MIGKNRNKATPSLCKIEEIAIGKDHRGEG